MIENKFTTTNHQQCPQKIAVIGDSHVGFFANYNETVILADPQLVEVLSHFTTFHLGPALAYNLNKYGTQTLAREKIEGGISNGTFDSFDTILCVFGEIDIRVHVLKQAEKNDDHVENVINSVITCYLEFLLFLKSFNKFRIAVWSPVAAGSNYDPQFPYYGTELQRNYATIFFNKNLEQACAENGIEFYSILAHLLDDKNNTLHNYYADGCHLNKTPWFFAKNIIQPLLIQKK